MTTTRPSRLLLALGVLLTALGLAACGPEATGIEPAPPGAAIAPAPSPDEAGGPPPPLEPDTDPIQ